MEQGFPDVSSPDRQKQAQNSRAQLRLRNVKQTELSSSNHTRLIHEKAQMGKLYYSRAGSSYFHFWWNSCGEPGVCAPSGGAKIYIARRNERFYQLKKERWRKRSTGLHFVLFLTASAHPPVTCSRLHPDLCPTAGCVQCGCTCRQNCVL